MLNREGFNLWANGYDKSVNLSEEANEYPFAGYKDVLGTIYRIIKNGKGKKILDIGFGTGVLSKKLYEEEYGIYGIDFSEKMIQIAKEKMPNANLIQADFSKGLPLSLHSELFDYIICTYAIHHLEDSQKIEFIQELLGKLSLEGSVLIGDVMFETLNKMKQCRIQNKKNWDEDERYPIVQLLKSVFPFMQFKKISFCAGVLSFHAHK